MSGVRQKYVKYQGNFSRNEREVSEKTVGRYTRYTKFVVACGVNTSMGIKIPLTLYLGYAF